MPAIHLWIGLVPRKPCGWLSSSPPSGRRLRCGEKGARHSAIHGCGKSSPTARTTRRLRGMRNHPWCEEASDWVLNGTTKSKKKAVHDKHNHTLRVKKSPWWDSVGIVWENDRKRCGRVAGSGDFFVDRIPENMFFRNRAAFLVCDSAVFQSIWRTSQLTGL